MHNTFTLKVIEIVSSIVVMGAIFVLPKVISRRNKAKEKAKSSYPVIRYYPTVRFKIDLEDEWNVISPLIYSKVNSKDLKKFLKIISSLNNKHKVEIVIMTANKDR